MKEINHNCDCSELLPLYLQRGKLTRSNAILGSPDCMCSIESGMYVCDDCGRVYFDLNN